jgi:hypothetical protein
MKNLMASAMIPLDTIAVKLICIASAYFNLLVGCVYIKYPTAATIRYGTNSAKNTIPSSKR